MISPNVTRRPPMPPRQETLTQHDELIKYIKEAWHKVFIKNINKLKEQFV